MTPENIADQLSKALRKKQLGQLVAAMIPLLSQAAMQTLLAEVGSDVKATLARLLDQVISIAHRAEITCIAKLVADWKKLMVLIVIGEDFGDADEYWIKWLIDAAVNSRENQAQAQRQFIERLSDWLTKLSSRLDDWNQRLAFYALTQDLVAIAEIAGRYPGLLTIVGDDSDQDKAAIAARQKWLKQIAGEQLFPLVMGCWEANIEKMMPNPANVKKGNYHKHVQWLAAAKEINPPAYRKILQQWHQDHRQRKKLWQTLGETS